MKLDEKKLAELNKQYGKLKKNEKIISIGDVKKRIDQIIDLTEELENLISEQMSAIEVFVDSCEDEACECGDEVEQSELYDLYSDMEDRILGNNLHKALRMIS